jgi:hypothetical protein
LALGATGAIGALAVLTGFVRVSGGFLIVPAFALLLGLPLTLAVGTSLLVIALTSAAAFVAHLASGSIDWAVALTFTAAAIAGAPGKPPRGRPRRAAAARPALRADFDRRRHFLVGANAFSAV